LNKTSTQEIAVLVVLVQEKQLPSLNCLINEHH